MGANETSILEAVVSYAASDIILFFVIVAVLVLPLYVFMLKDRKCNRQHESDRHAKDLEREREIIMVIKENSGVIASFKTLVEIDGVNTMHKLNRIQEKLDDVMQGTARIEAAMFKDKS